MNKEPKNIQKRSWAELGWLRAWLAVVAAVFVIVLVVTHFIPGRPPTFSDWLGALFVEFTGSLIVGTLVVCLWAFIRWLCSGNFKRFLFGLACVVTLIALAYAEEDLRGKLDWNSYKRQLEAKGEKTDFNDFVPPAVPDDENFAMTPIVSTSYGNILNSDGKVIPSNERNNNFVDRMGMSATENYDNAPTNGIGNWQTAKMSDLSAWQSYYRALARKTN